MYSISIKCKILFYPFLSAPIVSKSSLKAACISYPYAACISYPYVYVIELAAIQGMLEVSTTGGITSTWRSWGRSTTWVTGSRRPLARRWRWGAASPSPLPGTGPPNPMAQCGWAPHQSWSWPCTQSASCRGDLIQT